MGRSRLFPAKTSVEHYYFVTFVVYAEGTTQRLDNGVIAHHRAIEGLSDIRAIEEVIKGHTTAKTSKGGAIIGDAGIQVRILDYKVVRRE